MATGVRPDVSLMWRRRWRVSCVSLKTNGRWGEVFNIGNTESISIRDLATLVSELVNPDEEPKIEFISYDSFSGKYEDVRDRQPDVTKAREILGFEAKTAIREGMVKTVEWEKEARRRGWRS